MCEGFFVSCFRFLVRVFGSSEPKCLLGVGCEHPTAHFVFSVPQNRNIIC